MLPPVYPILDWDACISRGLEPAQLLRMWEAMGIDLCQLRGKPLSEDEYEQWARRMRSVVPTMRFVANDHAALAIRCRDLFWGLHLGQEDLEQLVEKTDVRRNLREGAHGLQLGVSTHTISEFRIASREPHISYIAIGPIFGTASKPGGKAPVLSPAEREEVLSEWRTVSLAAGRTHRRDLVIIGGLDPARFERLVPMGFQSKLGFLPIPAVISAAMDGDSLSRLLRYGRRLRLDPESTRHNLAES